MMEIKGKVNTALCYAKVIEDTAIEQIQRMCDCPFAEGSRIRIMPDVHAGKGCTIGTTMTVRDKAVPNAGRIMSRTDAKERLDMDEYRREMAGIYTTSVSKETLDEAPMAYKSLSDIIDVIRESVDVIEVLKPIYNFKAD
ncbi:MAG: RtcB family protein [Oscillospiraceae bacterium]|nr:RtcB family protein [Oscillospiraceae bacterium]MBQ3467452.1 RtcB family protein [Oscillospiraceae bacterium]